MRIAASHRPAHALTVGDRIGWERSGRVYAAGPPVRRDGTTLTALRATAYALTSLASLVFLALVALVAVRTARLPELFAQLLP